MNSIKMKGYFTIICLIFTILALSSCETKSSSNSQGEYCNSNGNIANSGISCLSDGWIYYSLPDFKHNFEVCALNKIYRVNVDGKKVEKVNDDPSAMINIQGDWIYYRNLTVKEYGSIYKIKKDGTGRKKITSKFRVSGYWPYGEMEYWVVGNKIYYLDFSYNPGGRRVVSKICSVDTEGKKFKVISNEKMYYVNMYDDWIYYQTVNKETSKLFRMKTDGTKKTLLYEGVTESFIIDGSFIYFIKQTDPENARNQLWKMNITSKKLTKIADDTTCFNISGDWIYVGIYNKGLYKINKLNHKKHLILSVKAQFIDISITGDWIHMRIFNNDAEINKSYDYLRLKTDGTKLSQIDNVLNEKAYADKKLYNKLYQKFNFIHVKGTLYYPKLWILNGCYPDWKDAKDIDNDERQFDTYDHSMRGYFNFSKGKNNISVEGFRPSKTINIKTKRKTGVLYYSKDMGFYGLAWSGGYTFNIHLDTGGNNYEVWKNILIDMLERVELKA
ncbi:MAG TPA: DUF5050 domain-containing protein [Clostridia bacterium]|nr:DUF5050 domain-containing protein [Clostridia bacterium]